MTPDPRPHEHGETTPDPTVEAWRPKARRAVLVSGGLGLALMAAAALVAWSWRDDLPDPVASHWGSGNAPDGFTSLGATIATLLGAGLGVLVLLGLIGLFLGQQAMARRTMSAAILGTSGFLALTLLLSLAEQRGLADATEAQLPGWVLAVAFGSMAVLGAVGWFLTPGDPPMPAGAGDAVPVDAPRVDLPEGARAAWVRTAWSPGGAAVGALATLVVVVVAVVTGQWALLAVAAVLLALLGAMLVFVVRVDARGLTVRSAVGTPRKHVPADEVVAARVVTVEPLRQFGGWGWRVGFDGGTGVVLRRGAGLRVELTGQRFFTVTVDDAGTAAALLNTMAERARA